MISVVTRSALFYRRREIWFYEGGPYPSDSNVVFYQASALPDGEVERVEQFITTCLDLTRSPEDLLGRVSKTTRYEIRKAKKLGVETERFGRPGPEQIARFVTGHRDFARSRGLGGVELERIERLVRAGAFTIAQAVFGGQVVTTHGYIHDETRTRLLISYGAEDVGDKALRGYANRLLHWEDILSFRRAGRTAYDFGGIDLDRVAGVARFKLSFGGNTESSRNCTVRTGLYGALRRWRERTTSSAPS